MSARQLGPLVLIVAVLLAAAPSTVTPAQEPPPETPLSLADSLRTALENNFDLVLARKDPQIAEQRIEVSRAKFDGVLGADATFSQDTGDETITDRPTGISTPGSSDSDNLSVAASFSHLLEFGGAYSATLRRNDLDRASRGINEFTGFFQDSSSNSTEDGLSLHYEMPLLAGLGREVNTVDVLLAQSGLNMSREQLRLSAIRTIKDVEDAYWNLVAAREALRVARESLNLAGDLFNLNTKKVEVGTLAPIEITQAEAGVASREEGVIVAETGVENAEDNLRRLMALPPDDPAWSQRIAPADPPRFEALTVDVDAALVTALAERPEIVNARQQVRDSELSERVARNRVRHTLNLAADLNPSQSDSDFRLTELSVPPVVLADTTTSGDGTGWQVGLVYRYPLRNREAKANYAIASLNRQKSETNLLTVAQDVRVDVRAAARSVESGAKRVAAAQASTVLQRKTLEAEQRKFENGMSTSFEVLRIQTDLSNAQLAEINALLDYAKALADLERAKGTLLEARGLSLGP